MSRKLWPKNSKVRLSMNCSFNLKEWRELAVSSFVSRNAKLAYVSALFLLIYCSVYLKIYITRIQHRVSIHRTTCVKFPDKWASAICLHLKSTQMSKLFCTCNFARKLHWNPLPTLNTMTVTRLLTSGFRLLRVLIVEGSEKQKNRLNVLRTNRTRRSDTRIVFVIVPKYLVWYSIGSLSYFWAMFKLM